MGRQIGCLIYNTIKQAITEDPLLGFLQRTLGLCVVDFFFLWMAFAAAEVVQGSSSPMTCGETELGWVVGVEE